MKPLKFECPIKVAVAFSAIALASLAGCIITVEPTPTPPAPVTIELYNPTTLIVTPNLFVSSSATDAAGLFTPANRVTQFTSRRFQEMQPGETITLTFECDEIRTVGVRGATLFDPAAVTLRTAADEPLLLREREFTCGGRVRFVYYTEGATFRVRTE